MKCTWGLIYNIVSMHTMNILYRRTVIDKSTGQKVVLSDADVQLVRDICANRLHSGIDQYPVSM